MHIIIFQKELYAYHWMTRKKAYVPCLRIELPGSFMRRCLRIELRSTGLHTCIKSFKILYKIKVFFKTCSKRIKWWNVCADIKTLSPRGCQSLPRGYIHVKKKCIKSDFKEIFLKLVTNDWSDKMFLFTSIFCPQWVVSPCTGAIYEMKNVYKIRLQIDVFEKCSKWPKWQEVSVTSKFCPLGVVCPWAAALYIY